MSYLSELVNTIHTANSSPSGKKFVISTTGGGFSNNYYLMSQPGASNTILELNGPYAREATLDLLNRDSLEKTQLDQFASINAATEMANVSLKRAHKLLTMQSSTIDQLICLTNGVGIGVACSLASSSWKRGSHRCHVVIDYGGADVYFSLNLYKGEESKPFRTRQAEDELCGALVVCAVAVASKIMKSSDVSINLMANCGLSYLDTFDFGNSCRLSHDLENLINKTINNVLFINENWIPNVDLTLLGEYAKEKPKIIMLPGSFNPFHLGHKSILDTSVSLSSLLANLPSTGIYELCVSNVDKPSMTYNEVMRRLGPFTTTPIILTNAPRFMDKAKQFPGVSFAIGVDTAIRLVDPKYTNGDEQLMIDAIINMTSQGTRFFVNSRTFGIAGVPPSFALKLEPTELLSLTKIMDFIPEVLRSFFIEHPNTEFKDISSSPLRLFI